MSRPKEENSKDRQYRLRMDERTAGDLEYINKCTGMPKSYILRELIRIKANEIRVINEENEYDQVLRECRGLSRRKLDYGL